MIELLIFLLAAAFGSFANVLVYRLPIMILSEGTETINLARPASHCPNCHSPIKWWQNIPLLSFLMLKRRCGQCAHVIAWRYFLIELGVVVIAFFCYISFGWAIYSLAVFSFLYLLWVLSWIDALYYLLPDVLTQLLLWLGLFYKAYFDVPHLSDAIFAAIFGFLILYLVYLLFLAFTGKDGLGFGDMKLMAAIGAWLGFSAVANVLIVSCLLALLFAVVVKALKTQNVGNVLPFGPFLALAATWVLLTHFDVGMWAAHL